METLLFQDSFGFKITLRICMLTCAYLREPKCFCCLVRTVTTTTPIREYSLMDRKLTFFFLLPHSSSSATSRDSSSSFFFYFAVSLKKRLCPTSPCRLPSTPGTASLPAVHPVPHLRTPQVTWVSGIPSPVSGSPCFHQMKVEEGHLYVCPSSLPPFLPLNFLTESTPPKLALAKLLPVFVINNAFYIFK